MTQRFPWSRLAEIAEAPRVEPVCFPGREEIATLKRCLRRMREALGVRGESPAAETEPGRRRLLR
jgi:hypothetical protein